MKSNELLQCDSSICSWRNVREPLSTNALSVQFKTIMSRCLTDIVLSKGKFSWHYIWNWQYPFWGRHWHNELETACLSEPSQVWAGPLDESSTLPPNLHRTLLDGNNYWEAHGWSNKASEAFGVSTRQPPSRNSARKHFASSAYSLATLNQNRGSQDQNRWTCATEMSAISRMLRSHYALRAPSIVATLRRSHCSSNWPFPSDWWLHPTNYWQTKSFLQTWIECTTVQFVSSRHIWPQNYRMLVTEKRLSALDTQFPQPAEQMEKYQIAQSTSSTQRTLIFAQQEGREQQSSFTGEFDWLPFRNP